MEAQSSLLVKLAAVHGELVAAGDVVYIKLPGLGMSYSPAWTALLAP